MVERRLAATLIPGLLGTARDALSVLPQGSLALGGSADGRAWRRSSPAAPVPWTMLDAGRALLLALLITLGGAATLFIARVLLSVGFLFAEGFGLVHTGTFDHLCSVFGPYSAATTTLLLGALLCCSLLYAIQRLALRQYGQSWAALGFRHIGWRIYGAAAASLPLVLLAGLIITRLEGALLGVGSIPNVEGGLLTRGMAPLPLNVLMLFTLLAVIVPIAEETFFRGFLLRLLRNRLPAWAAVPISAAAFAAAHGVPLLFPWLFGFGLIYAALAERTGSIYPGILLHALVNALATLSIVAALSGW